MLENEEFYEESKKELISEGIENPTQTEIYERAEMKSDAIEENKANDSKKRKRASAWFMGEAKIVVSSEEESKEASFANKDIAEEWVLNNLKAGEKAEISVVYKSFQSKEVVVNQIVED